MFNIDRSASTPTALSRRMAHVTAKLDKSNQPPCPGGWAARSQSLISTEDRTVSLGDEDRIKFVAAVRELAAIWLRLWKRVCVDLPIFNIR